jgi:hypothetical protein
MDGQSTHISRSYLMLDHHGRCELASLLRDTYARAQAIDRASRGRAAGDAARHELLIMSFEGRSGP